MSFSLVGVTLTLLVTTLCQTYGQVLDPHGPPRVDPNPMFLDSFVPAAMQIISHATELMKYEIPATETPTSTLPPSTSSHRPGIFAPDPTFSGSNRPPSFYYRLGEHLQEKNRLGNSYKRWVYSTRETGQKLQNKFKNEEYFGKIHSELHEKANTIGEDYRESFDDDQAKVAKFLEDYDDFDVASLSRKKKPPPPKAYVTLLSLYDSLNKEAKKLGMNKYAGYTRNVLQDLSEFSKGTSANQMREIFSKIVDRNEVRQEKVSTSLKTVIRDLDDPKSYINDALRYIPPLGFDSNF